MDELTLYKRELSASEMQGIFAAGAVGKCNSQTNCNLPSGLVAWWPLDGNVLDFAGTNMGFIFGNPVFTNGFVGQGMFFDGTNSAVRVPVSSELNFGTNNTGFSFEAWFNVPSAARRNPMFEFDDGGRDAGLFLFLSANTPGSVFAGLIDVNIGVHNIISGGGLFAAGVWTHVAVTYNKTNGMAALYVNGTVVQQQNLGTFTLRTLGNLFLGRRAAVGAEENFQGTIDEPSFYNRELSASEVQSIFLMGNAGKCRNRPWLTLSDFGGALAPENSINLTMMINTNANDLVIGDHFDTILITNSSNGRGSSERVVTLAVVNRHPILNAITSVQIPEDAGLQTVSLTGISAGGRETQALAVSASSSNPGLIANPIPVNYTSPSSNGTLSLSPITNAYGTTVVSVVVRDSGGTANGALDAVTNTFVLTVTPVNDPPSLAPVADQTIEEGMLLVITNGVVDPDLPDDQHTFSLLSPPAGAVIGATSGLFSWMPTEEQGPGTNLITVVVRDSGSPPLSATNRFTVRVLEVNSPPVLAPIANRTVLPGVPVNLALVASDSDIPANTLTFSLGAGAPAGASLNATNGLFFWTPPGTALPATNTFAFIVSDHGTPNLSDQRTVTFVVVTQPVIESINADSGIVTIHWRSLAGVSYRLQFKISLGQASWTDVAGDIPGNGALAAKMDSMTEEQRFYRVIVIAP